MASSKHVHPSCNAVHSKSMEADLLTGMYQIACSALAVQNIRVGCHNKGGAHMVVSLPGSNSEITLAHPIMGLCLRSLPPVLPNNCFFGPKSQVL